MAKFKVESTNKASERLVAVNFKGYLPCYIASEIHMILKNSRTNIIGEDYKLVWEDDL